MHKPNRAHYRIETWVGFPTWTPTDKVVCVFHARRVDRTGYRLIALASHNGMSRPIEQFCSECLTDRRRCEHDMQDASCPKIPGDTCGRDSDKELGGSW